MDLLGLGPKLCIQPRGTEGNNANRMTHRFERDVRSKYYLRTNSFGNNNEMPRLCRKWEMATTKGYKTNRGMFQEV